MLYFINPPILSKFEENSSIITKSQIWNIFIVFTTSFCSLAFHVTCSQRTFGKFTFTEPRSAIYSLISGVCIHRDRQTRLDFQQIQPGFANCNQTLSTVSARLRHIYMWTSFERNRNIHWICQKERRTSLIAHVVFTESVVDSFVLVHNMTKMLISCD